MSSSTLHRKPGSLAIKRNDAEVLTRLDIQYDLLYHIFTNSQPVFSDPNPTLHGDPPGTKVTFHDLYCNAIIRSPRASKVLRGKMLEDPQFCSGKVIIHYVAMISLLTNVGRINTTMAFFPELRTTLRTYHPIPALQRTDGSLQDAPRIKSILKSCLLENECQDAPSTPAEIISRRNSGHMPPTSVMNLIFVMATHSASLAQLHFCNGDGVDFLDLFLPIGFSSVSRAGGFLWLCFHYLEASLPNPFADEHASRNPGKIPLLRTQSAEEMHLENVDTEQEKKWGEKMRLQRLAFQTNTSSSGKSAEETRVTRNISGKGKGKIATEEYTGQRIPEEAKGERFDQSRNSYRSRELRHRRAPVDVFVGEKSNKSLQLRCRRTVADPQRSMMRHAWHIVSTTDPLLDSDEEHTDHHVRLDYFRRLKVISRLRGKTPTPEPDLTSFHGS